jgi:putative Holliday junction resolvase
MRAVALDIGEKRTGIAVSDNSGSVASPYKVLATAEVMANSPSFRHILENYLPDLLVIGLPLSLDGQEGSQVAKIKTMAQRVSDNTGIELCYVDERLSSIEAKRILRAGGYDERGMRGKIDSVSASLFLQAFLDSARQTGFLPASDKPKVSDDTTNVSDAGL